MSSEIVARYLQCWNETDAEARQTLVAEVFADDVRYVDPMVDVHGVEALDATIGAVQAQFPGFVFSAAGTPDAHHDVVRFGWALGPAGTEAPVVGFDVAVTGADGRIQSVHGFLDKVPATA